MEEATLFHETQVRATAEEWASVASNSLAPVHDDDDDDIVDGSGLYDDAGDDPGAYYGGSPAAVKPASGTGRQQQQQGRAARGGDVMNHRDALMQVKLLEMRLRETQLRSDQAEDQVLLLKQRIAEKDRRIAAYEEAKKDDMRLAVRVSSLEMTLRQRDGVIARAEAEITDLKSKIADLGRSSGRRGSLNSETSAEFQELHELKLSLLRVNKKYDALKQTFSRVVRSSESDAMAAEDALAAFREEREADLGRRLNVRQDDDDDGAFARSGMPGSGSFRGRPSGTIAAGARRSHSLVSFDTAKRSSRGAPYKHQFQEKLELKTPDDIYVDARLKFSGFQEQLEPMRKDVMKMLTDWKDFCDRQLSSLWFIFTERDKKGGCILANPKDDFFKETKLFASKTKQQLLEIHRNIARGVRGVLGNEGTVKRKWLLESVSRADASEQADIPAPDDPRLAEQREKILFLSGRLESTRKDLNAKVADIEMQRDKAEVNLQYLHNKVLDLHKELYSALHAVFKHRYKWTSRLPDPVRTFNAQVTKTRKKKHTEVNFNMFLGDLIDTDTDFCRRFGEYMVSDELFGADMTGVSVKNTAATPTDNIGPNTAEGKNGGSAGVPVAGGEGAVGKGTAGYDRGMTGPAADTASFRARRRESVREIFQRTAKIGKPDGTQRVAQQMQRMAVKERLELDGAVDGASDSPTSTEEQPGSNGQDCNSDDKSAAQGGSVRGGPNGPTQFAEFKRMNSWERHQKELWKEKRTRLMGPQSNQPWPSAAALKESAPADVPTAVSSGVASSASSVASAAGEEAAPKGSDGMDAAIGLESVDMLTALTNLAAERMQREEEKKKQQQYPPHPASAKLRNASVNKVNYSGSFPGGSVAIKRPTTASTARHTPSPPCVTSVPGSRIVEMPSVFAGDSHSASGVGTGRQYQTRTTHFAPYPDRPMASAPTIPSKRR